jgi:DNA (cytosine-5)-methyltransferase 1
MVLHVGTDCSGMGMPLLALRGLGITFRHIFASDTSLAARATLQANTPPEIMYDDLRHRSLEKVPAVDLYIAGFPCQPFSMAGLQHGFAAAGGNGLLIFHILAYIRYKQPRVFILEIVAGFVYAAGGEYFMAVTRELRSLQRYNLFWQILNTKEHGVPQNRPRVYFVGILQEFDSGGFAFPSPLTATPSIEAFLDLRPGRPCFLDLPATSSTTANNNVTRLLHSIADQGRDPFFEPWVLDCDSSPDRSRGIYAISPCLTRARGRGHWITNRGRRLNISEMLRLQGWNGPFNQVVTDSQMGELLGNAISVNVMQRLLCKVLPATGLCPPGSVPDPWVGR